MAKSSRVASLAVSVSAGVNCFSLWILLTPARQAVSRFSFNFRRLKKSRFDSCRQFCLCRTSSAFQSNISGTYLWRRARVASFRTNLWNSRKVKNPLSFLWANWLSNLLVSGKQNILLSRLVHVTSMVLIQQFAIFWMNLA